MRSVSKVSSDIRFLLGTKICPPVENNLSTGADDGKTTLYFRKIFPIPENFFNTIMSLFFSSKYDITSLSADEGTPSPSPLLLLGLSSVVNSKKSSSSASVSSRSTT
uniref:Uncharacterized protein n=1 Tax=Cacopsylla melanoneura TaxID=428564 RepID=A0A8D8XHB3_9HEMI